MQCRSKCTQVPLDQGNSQVGGMYPLWTECLAVGQMHFLFFQQPWKSVANWFIALLHTGCAMFYLTSQHPDAFFHNRQVIADSSSGWVASKPQIFPSAGKEVCAVDYSHFKGLLCTSCKWIAFCFTQAIPLIQIRFEDQLCSPEGNAAVVLVQIHALHITFMCAL